MASAITQVSSNDVPDDLTSAQWGEAWRCLVHKAAGTFDLTYGSGPMLRTDRMGMKASGLGPACIGIVEASMPYGARRTPAHIRGDDTDMFRVVMVISGDFLVTQDDRTTLLPAGDFTIVDYTRPYHMHPVDIYDRTPRRHAVMYFPRTVLPFRPDDIGKLTGSAIAGDRGAGALVAMMLRQVTTDFCGYEPATINRASTALVDLLTATVAEYLGESQTWSPESRRRTLLLRVRTFIDQHLADTELSVAVIAAAHHISTRQLHRLFAAEDTTVNGWIRRRRLDRCRTDLSDPILQPRTVSAIAARWGLTDAAHFSRLFHRTFGMAPIDYRHANLDPVAWSQVDGTGVQDRKSS